MRNTRYEVVPARHWRNLITGQTASIFGAAPYTSVEDEANWRVVPTGWTIRNNDANTVGIPGKTPLPTREEAEALCDKLNGITH